MSLGSLSLLLLLLLLVISAALAPPPPQRCRPSLCPLQIHDACDVVGSTARARGKPDREGLGNVQLLTSVVEGEGFRSPRGRARAMEDGAVVCVPGGDLPEFIATVFSRIPANHSIILVSADSDVGMPYDLFAGCPLHFTRAQAAAWGAFWRRPDGEYGSMGVRLAWMLEFLNDARLRHWYVQNYDLVGCGPYSDSPVQPADPAALKVSPFPIKCQARCVPPGSTDFSSRQRKLLVGLPRMSEYKLGRPEALAAAAGLPAEERTTPDISRQWSTGPEIDKWLRLVETHRYVLCPAGNGVDTRRVWEALQHGAIPVVLSSPLDALYGRFPIVIVRVWRTESLRMANLDRLLREAGWLGDAPPYDTDPFEHPAARRLLDPTWWEQRVRSGQPTFDRNGGLERTALQSAGVYPGCTPPAGATWEQLPQCAMTRSGVVGSKDSIKCSQAVHAAMRTWRPPQQQQQQLLMLQQQTHRQTAAAAASAWEEANFLEI